LKASIFQGREQKMKCPVCETRNEIDLGKSDGYSSESPVKECGKCGLVWRIVPDGNDGGRLDIIHQPQP